MAPEQQAANEVRLSHLEAGQSETFRRLRMLDRMAAELEAVKVDVKECADDSAAIRTWVENQIKAAGEANLETRKLSSGEKVAIIGAVALVLAALLTSIANVIDAGTIGIGPL